MGQLQMAQTRELRKGVGEPADQSGSRSLSSFVQALFDATLKLLRVTTHGAPKLTGRIVPESFTDALCRSAELLTCLASRFARDVNADAFLGAFDFLPIRTGHA